MPAQLRIASHDRNAAVVSKGVAGTVPVRQNLRAGWHRCAVAGRRHPREGVSGVNAEVVPLLMGGGDLRDDFLRANGVRVAHQGHLPFAGAVKGIYDTLKVLRAGVASTDMGEAVASTELIGQLTRRSDYDRWTSEYLN